MYPPPHMTHEMHVSSFSYDTLCLDPGSSGVLKVPELGVKADRVEERCCRMAPHGDNLCVDVLLCLIERTARPTGRTAQPQAACTKPFNGPCGQGAILVAQATATHMPCELWLHYCIEKYAPRKYVGRGGRHSESAQSVLLR